MRSSLTSAVLKETSFSRFKMSRAVRGVPARSIGLMAIRIVSFESHSRTSGVMVGVPEKPPSQ